MTFEFESEIKQLSDEFLTDAANNSGYAIYLEDVIKLKSRQLQPESEMILAALNPVLELPDNGYNITKLSDMKFNSFEVDGVEYPLSFVQFENSYQSHPPKQGHLRISQRQNTSRILHMKKVLI